MNLFEKIEWFQKLANEITDQDAADDLQEAETIEEYTSQHLERSATAKLRISKLAAIKKK